MYASLNSLKQARIALNAAAFSHLTQTKISPLKNSSSTSSSLSGPAILQFGWKIRLLAEWTNRIFLNLLAGLLETLFSAGLSPFIKKTNEDVLTISSN